MPNEKEDIMKKAFGAYTSSNQSSYLAHYSQK
jgi:hypothetical protein